MLINRKCDIRQGMEEFKSKQYEFNENCTPSSCRRIIDDLAIWTNS